MKYLAIGDCVCDKYLDQKMMYPGGTALNAAAHAAEQGAESAFIGVIGNDPEGEFLKRIMDQKGIDRSHAKLHEGETTSSHVDLVEGERKFLWANGMKVRAEHPLVLTEEDLEYISGFDLVHMSVYSGMEEELPKLRAYLDAKEGPVPRICFDFSDAWRSRDYAPKVKDLCKYIDVVFLSCAGQKRGMTMEIIKLFESFGPKLVVATRGSDSTLILSTEDKGVWIEKEVDKLQPVDTLGAGDSFASAFETSYILSLQQNESPKDAASNGLKAGSELASKVCMMYGGFGCGVPIE